MLAGQSLLSGKCVEVDSAEALVGSPLKKARPSVDQSHPGNQSSQSLSAALNATLSGSSAPSTTNAVTTTTKTTMTTTEATTATTGRNVQEEEL